MVSGERKPLTSCLWMKGIYAELRAARIHESSGVHQFFVLHDLEHFRAFVCQQRGSGFMGRIISSNRQVSKLSALYRSDSPAKLSLWRIR